MRSNRKKSERGDGEVAFVLFLALVVIIIMLIIAAIRDAARVRAFDRSFEKGQITFSESYVPLGQSGNPMASSLPDYIPEGDDESPIEDHPRLYTATKCIALDLPDGAKGVHVSTPYFDPSQVIVTVPAFDSGKVNVCVPSGVSVQVVVWSDRK